MSDWLPNSIEVVGDKIDLLKFKNDVSGYNITGEKSVFAFTKIIPLPEYLSESDDEQERDWLRLNWGTRNDTVLEELEEYEDSLVYMFQTINSPPYPIYGAIIKRYPNLEFSIHVNSESGDEFFLKISASGGKIERFICDRFEGFPRKELFLRLLLKHYREHIDMEWLKILIQDLDVPQIYLVSTTKSNKNRKPN